MRSNTPTIIMFLAAALTAAAAHVSLAQKGDGNWPRVIQNPEAKVVVYQPQLESFDQIKLRARAAVGVTARGKDPVFGAVWFEARTFVDRETRVVTLAETRVTDIKFPNATPEQETWLRNIIEAEIPRWGNELSYDELVAGLAVVESEQAASAKLNTAPPEVIFTTKPTMLITIDGEPIIKEVEGTSLKSVVNTPFFIVQDSSTKVWYLKGNESWYFGSDVVGPWNIMKNPPPQAVADLAAKMVSKPPEDAEKPAVAVVPDVIVRTKPAEIVQCDGEPKFEPVQGTNLLFVKNTESSVIMDIPSQQYYILLAGRWYQSKSIEKGPWTFVPGDKLPADFARIPADSDLSDVLASVPGTEEAKEAVLENQIPQTAEVDRKTATVAVKYDGDPKFEKIEGTDMSYAVNTDKSVLLIGGRYYCCDQAVWFESDRATGPWVVSTKVPADVQSIPPDSPVYNTKYVYIYDSTPEVVYVGYTPAYYGSYVYGGCVVYGTGYYYHPWYGHYYYPRPVTYGFAVAYNPYTGWGFSFGMSYGWFSVSFGGYGGYWGPMGYHHGYNHGYYHGYHHGYRHGYGAGYGAGYRAGQAAGARPTPYTNNAYKARNNGVRSTPQKPSQMPAKGGNVATRPSTQPANKARPSTQPNNVYADRNGNVYRNDNGKWEQRSGNGWTPSKTGPSQQPATGARPSTPSQRPATPSTQP
ncbi:MAG TPA: hypothetical protein VFH88_00810, partial [Candidatus Krumholzibacteria bacterium]|nr:hypothetical protein [Candidatus Krumholzibacteria bacterium]